MMCFTCQGCGQPCTTTTVYAWSFERPVCKAACVALLPPPQPADRRAELDRALKLLAQGVHTIDHALNLGARVRTDQKSAEAMQVAGMLVGGLTGGVLGAGVMGSVLAPEPGRNYGRLEDVLWALDQHLVVIARQLMSLHAHGFAIAAPMRPLVMDYDPLVSTGSMISRGELLRLRELIIHLHGGIGVWRAELA